MVDAERHRNDISYTNLIKSSSSCLDFLYFLKTIQYHFAKSIGVFSTLLNTHLSFPPLSPHEQSLPVDCQCLPNQFPLHSLPNTSLARSFSCSLVHEGFHRSIPRVARLKTGWKMKAARREGRAG